MVVHPVVIFFFWGGLFLTIGFHSNAEDTDCVMERVAVQSRHITRILQHTSLLFCFFFCTEEASREEHMGSRLLQSLIVFVARRFVGVFLDPWPGCCPKFRF